MNSMAVNTKIYTIHDILPDISAFDFHQPLERDIELTIKWKRMRTLSFLWHNILPPR